MNNEKEQRANLIFKKGNIDEVGGLSSEKAKKMMRYRDGERVQLKRFAIHIVWVSVWYHHRRQLMNYLSVISC